MKLIRKITELFRLTHQINRLQHELENQKLLLGKSLALQLKTIKAKRLSDVEFKVFSQYGDDGIIQYLVQHLEIEHPYFIEFGVENYTESNTRFLLMNNNWKGLIFDGSQHHIQYVKKDIISRQHELQAECAFIDAENINALFHKHDLPSEVGLLSIDIDGNDYWVWKAIDRIHPVIVISEFNSVWGADKPYTVPYDPTFYRTTYHHTNLCYGSSLLSLCDLAEEKGYAFIGCNSAGNNAYFVRKDKLNHLFPSLTAAQGYVRSAFGESRSKEGLWTNLKGDERLKALQGVTVYNTRTSQEEKIA